MTREHNRPEGRSYFQRDSGSWPRSTGGLRGWHNGVVHETCTIPRQQLIRLILDVLILIHTRCFAVHIHTGGPPALQGELRQAAYRWLS